MENTIEIRADGNANAQVTDRVKERIHSWLSDRGVNTDEILLHHYKGGEFVAVRSLSRGSVPSAFNSAYDQATGDYWRNREIHDNCFWIHREWIDGL